MKLTVQIINTIMALFSNLSGILIGDSWPMAKGTRLAVGVAFVIAEMADICTAGRVSMIMLGLFQSELLLRIIIIISLLPPVVAFIERAVRNDKSIASNVYLRNTMVYNIFSDVAAVSLFRILTLQNLDSYAVVRSFPVLGMIAFIIQLSILVTVIYQEKEMSANTEDHSTDTQYINQKLNMIWISAILDYNIALAMLVIKSAYEVRPVNYLGSNRIILVLPWAMLLFFYACAFNRQKHIRFLFEVCTPVLIVSIFFLIKRYEITYVVVLFMILAYLIYAVLMLKVLGFLDVIISDSEDKTKKGIKKGKKRIVRPDLFGVSVVVFIILICFLTWMLITENHWVPLI